MTNGAAFVPAGAACFKRSGAAIAFLRQTVRVESVRRLLEQERDVVALRWPSLVRDAVDNLQQPEFQPAGCDAVDREEYIRLERVEERLRNAVDVVARQSEHKVSALLDLGREPESPIRTRLG